MMKRKKQQLIIPFIGLKEGKHQFEFEIDSAFFEQFEFSIIKKANFKIVIDFEKKPSLFNLDFKLDGTIYSNCDRCNDELAFHATGSEELIVKIDDETYDETDEIKVISSSDYELDLKKEIYEYIHLLLPTKLVHDNIADCNQEVIEKLNQLNTKTESSATDPRWSALSKLKDKSN
ncbi:MAG: DUF177 domain-containing protein [Vicingaceae bacterium]